MEVDAQGMRGSLFGCLLGVDRCEAYVCVASPLQLGLCRAWQYSN